MRISDWSSDVCSSDLVPYLLQEGGAADHFLGVQEEKLEQLEFLRRQIERPVLDGDGVPKAIERHRSQRQHLQVRKSVVTGKRVSVRVDLGGRRIIKNKTKAIIRTKILYTRYNE